MGKIKQLDKFKDKIGTGLLIGALIVLFLLFLSIILGMIYFGKSSASKIDREKLDNFAAQGCFVDKPINEAFR